MNFYALGQRDAGAFFKVAVRSLLPANLETGFERSGMREASGSSTGIESVVDRDWARVPDRFKRNLTAHVQQWPANRYGGASSLISLLRSEPEHRRYNLLSGAGANTETNLQMREHLSRLLKGKAR